MLFFYAEDLPVKKIECIYVFLENEYRLRIEKRNIRDIEKSISTLPTSKPTQTNKRVSKFHSYI